MRKAVTLVCASALLAVSVLGAAAQGSRKPGTKPKPRTTTKPPAAQGLKGTAQMPGDNCKLNVTYQLAGSTEHAVHFNLLSTEYSAGRLLIGTDCYSAKSDQKLLLLGFTIQNPNKGELLCRFDTIRITAVDSKDVNHEWIGNIAKAGETKSGFDANLKPGQKVQLVSAVVVPADVSIPKLIVQHSDDKRVLRYDLRDQIKPLPAPFADPADKTGCTVQGPIPAEKGVYYPFEAFDVKWESAAFAPGKLGDEEPGENKRFLAISLTFRNATNSKRTLRFDTLAGTLKTADGDKIESRGWLLKATRDDGLDVQADPGETFIGRIVFEMPKDVQPAKVTIWEGEAHKYVFDVSDLK